jgi:hypothetical protein
LDTGIDPQALFRVLMPSSLEGFRARLAGLPTKEVDLDEMNAKVALLPDRLDEDLR